MPPAKKLKRSHTSGSTSPSPTSPVRATAPKSPSDDRATTTSRIAQHTPPPSPTTHGSVKIDTQGIDDEIVVAVIEQLEKTGNKPHLLKELAAVLSTQLAIVQSSANQSAIISSRLTSYLRRPWSALAPCPVGKELIGTHPKRIYFFLAGRDHQPFPDPEEVNAQNAQARAAARIISPSLSSNASSAAESTRDEEEQSEVDRRARQQLSPSPELELDLSIHDAEMDDNGDPPFDIDMELSPDVAGLTHSFSGRGSLSRSGTLAPSDVRRAVSPPLEGDEREFTRTASELQALAQMERAEEARERERRASRELSHASGSASASSLSAGAPATPSSNGDNGDVDMESGPADVAADDEEYVHVAPVEESEETCALRNSECAAALFGGLDGQHDMGMLSLAATPHHPKSVHFGAALGGSSPLVRPTTGGGLVPALVGGGRSSNDVKWSELELKSPETVDLAELDDLFDSY